MKTNNDDVKTLTINELLNKDKYIIPIYQRNYAWGDDEISLLIQDLWNAYEKNENNYYIGSLVIYKRGNGDLEVIDGQQRLTTLTLIMHYLKSDTFVSNVSFEHRNDSDNALGHLDSDSIPDVFKNALKSIKKYWETERTEKEGMGLAEFLQENVKIIRTEVPEDTDLNHYFEIMNTRGEQLEKHEIIKADLMKVLDTDSERSIFAKIWDACSDMSRYVVMGINSSLRENIFGKNWENTIPKKFNEIIENIADAKKTQHSDNGSANEEQSILQLITADNGDIHSSQEQPNEQTDGRFNSVIDFPNFLMHILKIYLEKFPTGINEITFKEIPLDEKELWRAFDNEDWNKEKIVNFIDTLLSCRYLFDKYIIKSNSLRSENEHWSLWEIKKEESKNYYYKNVFGIDNGDSIDTQETNDKTKNAIMLLSMFHVSNPSRIYKNWLYATLRWLFENKKSITQETYIQFLENLCDKFYFENNCNGNRDFMKIILNDNYTISSVHKSWNDGVNVPNFVFNRLDYQLWKYQDKVEVFSAIDQSKQSIWKNFRFSFRSSVEHHYPQNPSQDFGLDKLDTNVLDNFGNLYLLSQSKNSSFSNKLPDWKRQYYKGKDTYDSLKQAIMMSYENWTESEIKDHEKKMLEILNEPLTDSSYQP